MGGFGSDPFGLFPFGDSGSSTSSTTPGSRTTPARARRVVAGDYVLEVDGGLAEIDPVDAEVQFRLATVLGTAANATLVGNGIFRVQAWTAGAEVRIRREVELALQPMLDRHVIADLDVEAAPFLKNGTAVAAYKVAYQKTGQLE